MASPFDDIFGGAGPQWTRDQIVARIRGEADRQKVDPDLAVAVATQESSLKPDNHGDNGKSRGLFHLQEKAAIDAGINPTWRDDPGVNIYGGVRYLKQKLDQSGGNVEQALSRYNRGTPDYQGIGDPNYVNHVLRHYSPQGALAKEQPTLLARAATFLQPASAEAATPQQAQATSSPVWDDIFGAAPAARPSPPTATSTPEQDTAYKASRGTPTPPPVSQTPPTPQAPPGASQGPLGPSTGPTAGMRFQALPSIQALSPEERIRYQQEFEALSPALQEEFLRSEAPADLPGAPQAARAPQAPAAVAVPAPVAPPPPRGPASSTRIEPLQPGASEVALAEVNRPHEAGIPLSAVPAIAVNTLGTVGGAAVGALTSPVTGILGPAAGAALGGSLATRANVAMGLAPQEKPLLETPVANVYPSDLLGAIPLGIATGTAALKGTVRNLPGANVGRHELAAERLEQLGQRTAPPVASEVLWQKAGQSNTPIATIDVWRTAGDVVRRKSRTPNLSADDPALKAAQDLLSLAKKHGGPVPMQELDDARRNLVPHLRDPDVKQLYGAVLGDMDTAVARGVPGAADLRGAIAATRKEHSHAELTDLWSQGKGMQFHEGDKTQIFGKRIKNQFEQKMKADKTFAGAFTPEELTDIRSTLREVGKLTVLTNPSSQGPLRWLGSLTGAAYGVSSGDFWTTGAAILASQGASTVMASAMQSKVGRWALREAIREGNGKMTHGSLAAIAALVAREAAPDAPVSEQKP